LEDHAIGTLDLTISTWMSDRGPVDQVTSLSCFDHYVINIDGNCWFWPLGLIRLIEWVNLVGEALLHAPLVGGTSILQAKRHGYIKVQTIWGDE